MRGLNLDPRAKLVRASGFGALQWARKVTGLCRVSVTVLMCPGHYRNQDLSQKLHHLSRLKTVLKTSQSLRRRMLRRELEAYLTVAASRHYGPLFILHVSWRVSHLSDSQVGSRHIMLPVSQYASSASWFLSLEPGKACESTTAQSRMVRNMAGS